MEDQVINLETGMLTKEKGFDLKTEYVYAETWCFDYEDHHTGNEYHAEYVKPRLVSSEYPGFHDHIVCKAPTQSLLQKWLREVHNVHCWVTPESLQNFNYHYFNNGGLTHSKDGFITYENAMEAVLQESLNTLKTIK